MSPELDAFFRIGQRIELGRHTFSAEEIIAYAREFDPQDFHTDEALAADSLFGGLCASGWHTCAMWMRYNYAELERVIGTLWQGDGPQPEFGPSPGFKDLRWLKPIHAGDSITFTRTAVSYRALASKPGWLMLLLKAEAFNERQEPVMEMENSVLVAVRG